MKRNKFYLLAAATALFLSACNNEEVPGTQESDLARFTGSIEGVKTRAYDTTWENGDAIGIIGGGYTDIRYVHHNGLWAVEDASGPILFQTPDDVDFTAYYPQGAETTDVTIGANTAQRKIDFLYGTGTGGVRTDGVVDFSFSHRMSRLVLNFIAGPGVDLADLSGYTLSGLSMTGSFDTATGTAYATGAASDLTMDATGITSSSLILFPQEGYEATLKVALGGQTFTATLNLPMADVMNGLESSYSYSYNVTIKKEGLSITQAGIEPWENAQVENSGNVNATI